MTGIELAKAAAQVLDDKLGVDVKILKVEDLTILTDYFVIASGTSNTQVRALADEVEQYLEKSGAKPRGIEGNPDGGWVLLDYGTVIIHVFHAQAREFYSLERLWADAKQIDTEMITD